MNIKHNKYGNIILLGKSNVGKSTLLNKIIKDKISITSRKRNTTKNNIIWIHSENIYKTIYIDTPGIQENDTEVINSEIKYILNTIDNTIILFVLNRCQWTKLDDKIVKNFKNINIPILIVINKIDLIKKKNILLPYINFLTHKIPQLKAVIPISSKKDININNLINLIDNILPLSKYKFQNMEINQASLEFDLSEIIREQLIRNLGDELPSIIDVTIELLKKTKKNYWIIKALIFVNNHRQKNIIIGKKGEKIKFFSIISRKKIEKKLKSKIYLSLWIKVKRK